MIRQAENSKKTSLAIRLERLRAATSKTWDSMAADLGVKVAMMHHVRVGRRGFSEKVLDRLVDLEVAAGVRTEASVLIERGLSGDDLIQALIDGPGQSSVTIKDIDEGSKMILLDYRRGSPPPNFPTTAKVVAAGNASIHHVLGEQATMRNPSGFLAACLPDLKDKLDVLERLTPSCYALILHTALDLTFGIGWRSKIETRKESRSSK